MRQEAKDKAVCAPLTDYSKIDDLSVWYKFVHLGKLMSTLESPTCTVRVRCQVENSSWTWTGAFVAAGNFGAAQDEAKLREHATEESVCSPSFGIHRLFKS